MSESNQHTAEPWRLGNGHCVVADEPVHEMNGSDALEYYGGHLIAESVVERNARRIVACVNELAGVHEVTGYVHSLEEQRDKLLTLLEAMVANDTYEEEYDGRMYSICHGCGAQDDQAHADTCDYVIARAFIAEIKASK